MAPDADPDRLADLIVETRAVRLALRDLIERLRRDRSLWKREAAELALRARLTSLQRSNLRRHLPPGRAADAPEPC